MSAPRFCFTQLPFKGQPSLQLSPVSAADKDGQTFGARATARAHRRAIRQRWSHFRQNSECEECKSSLLLFSFLI